MMCATCGCSEGDHQHHDHDHHHHDHDHHHHDHDHHHHDHDHHGHEGADGSRTLRLEQAILAKNERIADENRRWLAERRILTLNVVSSPGAGKTTLLERTIADLGSELSIKVVEGDQSTTYDADRIRSAGAEALQINTGSGCHLDADMLEGALKTLDPPDRSVLFIENVGNLVCPALFDLGEQAKVVVASVPEGDDKPIKYPHMFRAASLLLLNKTDLLPYVRFDVSRCIQHARQVNPEIEVISVSATEGYGLESWYAWIRSSHGRI